MNKFNLGAKIAVVIGGAGGIGEACSYGLAEQGATTIIASRNLDKVQAVADQIKSKTGAQTGAFQVDVTDEDSVEQLASQIAEQYGRVDILVNTHGMNKKGAPLEFDMDDWDNLFLVNVKGVMMACRAFAKIMIKQGKGKIINMSSVRGVRGTGGGNVAYGATKGAVDMITRMLAAEWAPFNINVNAMAPSLVLTDTIKKAVAPERLEMLAKSSLFNRLGTPDEMAGACIFLASEASDFMTGQILYVDGGLTAVG